MFSCWLGARGHNAHALGHMGATRRGTYAATEPATAATGSEAPQLARRPRQRGCRRSLGGTNALEKRSGPNAPIASKHKKHHGRAEAFLIAAHGHASLGDPHGRLRERDPLSAILARLARPRRKKGEESAPAPETPLATTAPPEAAPVTPAAWTGPLGTPDDPITIDIDLAQ